MTVFNNFYVFFRGLVPISYINIIVDMMNVQHETAVTVHENLLPGNQRIWQCFATRYKIYSELRNFCKLLCQSKCFFFLSRHFS